jgi:outer membrane protein OmpA-like peptidoglycan-associated protein
VEKRCSNTDLSERRAQAIVQALVSGGIDSNRLAPQAYSESRPVAENTTTEGRARNRRVEFRIIE